MYHIDPNVNTAVERQAEWVREVQASGAREPSEQPLPGQAAEDAGRAGRLVHKAGLALAVAAPLVLLVVWGLLAR